MLDNNVPLDEVIGYTLNQGFTLQDIGSFLAQEGVSLDQIASFVARYNYPIEDMGNLLREQGFTETDIEYLG